MSSPNNQSSILKLALFVCLYILLSCQSLHAQHDQFKFRHLNIKNGLSDHEVISFCKDSRGFMWLGTNIGLNRFDGYEIRRFLNDSHDTTSLADNWVRKIFETPDNRIAILGNELCLYDPDTEKFSRNVESFYRQYGTSKELKNIVRDVDGGFWFLENNKVMKYFANGKIVTFQSIAGDTSSITNQPISQLCLDKKGSAWIIHVDGIVEKLTVDDNRALVTDRIYSAHEFNGGKQANYDILSDADGDLWFSAENLLQGVLFFDINTRKIQSISARSAGLKLNTNRISCMIEARDRMIWIGTDHGGINVIDKKEKKVRFILHRDEDPSSLSENSIRSMYKDDQGIMWIATYKRGVSYYHENIYRFDVYKHSSLDPAGLPFEDVNRFEEDAKGNLWIGTNGGGLIYFDRKAGTFKQYRHEPGNNKSISGNVIVSLWMDKEQNLWIGTYNDGLNKFDGKNFTRYSHVEGDSTSLPSQNIWDLFEDSKGRFWIGTLDAGVALMDKKTGKFSRLKSGANEIRSSSISAFMEDRRGQIWIGSIFGVDVLSADGKKFTHYETSPAANSLSNNRVLDVIEDSKGRVWVATIDGLNLFSDSLNGFITIKQQLPHSSVMDVREDNTGTLWMSTLNGLCEMTMNGNDPNKAFFRHYAESDGLQGSQFNINAAFKMRSGELVFGGPTGFNIFSTTNDVQKITAANLTFTDLKLFQEKVKIGESFNGVIILPKAIAKVKELVLPPNSNFFSIQISSLNYFNPQKSRYAYKIDGLNHDWLKVPEGSHEIPFSGLSPGKYKLRVRSTDIEGIWRDQEIVLPITIQPPFWKTKTAFGLYAALLICVLFLARKLIQQREKLKFALEQEREEIRRVHELDMLKVKFFTNVSHEFRTPLTLILTPIEKLIKSATGPEQFTQFQLIQRNGNRLMKLVNQLLDFKKMEVQEINFDPTEGDIIVFTRDIVLSFSDLAEKKNISLQFHSSLEHFQTLFDADKLEKILFNLLSNAFKFTLDNGTITVNIDRVSSEKESLVEIKVVDSGIGIPSDKADKIFEPFFQNELPKSIVNQGSGIGLAITKEFVRIHRGTIDVTSEVGKGSVFTIRLPLTDISATATTEQPPREPVNTMTENKPEVAHSNIDFGEEERKTLLLVEDDEDVRFYLKDNLKFQYKIYESRNGADAWGQILEFHPDLIVSDITMPELNGIDLCRRIKTDERVSHIPVILLTARSNDQQRLEGLKVGADDYITKPFNFEVLEARIENLLQRQQKSQKALRKTLDVKASELEITPLDEKFIERAIKCVEANISLAEFSVEDFASELGISRAYVFKKIQVLTGKTPLEFMRTIRLQHAAQLLEKSQLSVREIAYKVGFNSPKYFAKYFKEHFNVLPSNYAASKREEND